MKKIRSNSLEQNQSSCWFGHGL
ncbi:unnamed protein product [Lathyrus oleraceus]